MPYGWRGRSKAACTGAGAAARLRGAVDLFAVGGDVARTDAGIAADVLVELGRAVIFPQPAEDATESSTMKVVRGLALLVIGMASAARASNHEAPPVQPATTYPAVEVHDKENVAIAIEPDDTKEKESIFRADDLGHGATPVRLIVTNNGDKPISLRDARILFYTSGGDRINAADPEDVERSMTRTEREGRPRCQGRCPR